MTVVLAGVGADTTNLGALGRLTADGRFDYVPIPEKTRTTSETATLGSWPLRTSDETAAALTTRITPRPARDPDTTVTGEALESWPLHRDPNFAALTYGEHRSTGYVERLAALEPGDAVGFYAGLRGPEGRAHRYLIGWLTVAAVHVCDPADPERTAEILADHPRNAHAKRATDGTPYLEKPLVIVDGREPGGLVDRHPPRLSEYDPHRGYSLDPAMRDSLSITAGSSHMGYKPAYRCGVDPETALERLSISLSGKSR